MSKTNLLWLFIEFPNFTRECKIYFTSDLAYWRFQVNLAKKPLAGDPMPGCGGLRKIRWADATRGKGKRGGLRIIYLQVPEAQTIVLVTVYGKDEQDTISHGEKKQLATLAAELKKEIVDRSFH